MSRIVTERLHLLHPGANELRLLADNPIAFERAQQVRLADGVLEILQKAPFEIHQAIAEASREGAEGEWRLPWIMIHRAERTVIGFAGFGKAPNLEGGVELAYGIAAEVEPLSYAGEAIAGMVRWAFRNPAIRKITIRLPKSGPAEGPLLASLGFRLEGGAAQSNIGPVEVWSREPNPEPQPASPP